MTQANLDYLANTHILRYASRLTQAIAGKPGFIRSECEELLGIWQSIVTKGYSLRPDDYTDAELRELTDAYFDEYGYPEDYSEEAE